MKKRIINIRVMASIFIGLIAGILICYLFFISNFNNLYLIFTPIIVSVIFVGFIIYAYLTSKKNRLVECRKDVSKYLIISTWGFVVAFLIGIVITAVFLFPVKNYKDVDDVVVTGVVSDYVLDSETHKRFVIDDCSVVLNDEAIYEDIKICIYTSISTNIGLGDTVYFVGDLSAYNYRLNYEFDKLAQNIAFSTYVNYDEMTIFNGDPEFKDIVKNKVKSLLDENMNKDNASIAYSVLFGEKQGLAGDIKQSFSYAGISHILAVSGLHIGVLVTIISFLLFKIKMNKYIRILILSIILIFYSYLCSFSPSVLRASIMAVLSALCFTWQVEYDILSSLSIAGIVVLLVNPLNLFLISFQLSFLCVLSIIAFAPTIEGGFKKLNCPKFLASSLAISISSNIIILPVCFNYFDYVSILGVLSNIIVLPIFSIVYVLLFALVIVGCLLPFVGGLLIVPSVFLHLIKLFATYISNISSGIFQAFHVGYVVLFLLIVIYLITHFVMVKKWIKLSFVGVCSLVFAIIFTINCMPINYSKSNLLVYYQNKSNVVFYVEDDEVTMIGSDIDRYYLIKQLKHFKIKNIDRIIAYDFKLNKLTNFNDICEEFDVKEVYLPNKLNYSSLLNKLHNVILYEDKLLIKDLVLENIVKDDIIGVKFNIDNKIFVIPELSPTIAESNYIMNTYTEVDYIIVSDMDIKINLYKDIYKNIVTLNTRETTLSNEINLNDKISINLVGGI